MAPLVRLIALLALSCGVHARTGTSNAPVPTLRPQIDAAPSLTPTVLDPKAPNAQKCPGYEASNVVQNAQGVTADLTIAGANCQAFGNDIHNLVLKVQYQTKERLNVRIFPKYLSARNTSQHILSSSIVAQPQGDGKTTKKSSDLVFEWSNTPTFQFKISRASNGEQLFSTYGHVIVYEDQFLELVTNMVPSYNVYGLAENIHDFYLGQNYTQTYYAVDAGNTIDGNVYGTHPFYQETRYHGSKNSTSHGVYARNAHGQEWLLRTNSITYRTLGGSFDFYFISGQTASGGSSAVETIRQYQAGCVGLPAMQMFWTFGFHQCRWGYENVSVLQEVVDNYRKANIPLECMWNDIDIYQLYRDFTNNPVTYPSNLLTEFIQGLHKNNQHYVPIIDSNIYVPNPKNASDAYAPFQNGADLGTYIRNPATGTFYYGDNWPGFSVWADWLVSSSQAWWTREVVNWHKATPFDGIWIDLSEASSFCAGSCGSGRLTDNPAHPPFLLPGDVLTFDYEYPEGFNVTNRTEAASASRAAASQSSALLTTTPLPPATTTTLGRTEPTPGLRNLTYPPYVINNVQAGHALVKGAISPDATHNDPYNTTEYELHNVFGYQISNATYHALLAVFPGKRPFTVGRSTFAGSGQITSHWGGDNTSKWGSMFLSISQALTFMMAGIPMFGADSCGFTHNTDYDLCSRWMELSAFFPFYRNHNVKATISQEAYVWSSVAEASRRAIAVRYSLLNYMYTLFYYAHTQGDTVMRALAWEFPQDESLKATFAQFMLGPSLLITPVLTPSTTTVRGVFPGIGEGTRWYDWYTLREVHAKPQENLTMSAPLEHINVHARGGTVFTLQEPKYTTEETKASPYALLVTLDPASTAIGTVYLDDGVSLVPSTTKVVTFNYYDNCLRSSIKGTYKEAAPLTNITIAGLQHQPKGFTFSYNGKQCTSVKKSQLKYSNGTAYITGLSSCTPNGAFGSALELRLT